MSITTLTPADLIAYEREIAELFNSGAIHAPVHLSGGNEEQLIDIFKEVRQEDWVCTTWRSHYHCLLKGVPAGMVTAAIMQGRSITLTFPEYRVFSSAILGGHLPIALGLALSIKRSGGKERVWCFLGDMAAHSGIYYECHKYSFRNELPITWVVESNGKSVCTDTEDAWGGAVEPLDNALSRGYEYELPYPHSGAGKRVNF